MSSAGRSTETRARRRPIGGGLADGLLSGPVAVCIDRPVLSLDRPFTYELTEDLGAGIGSLVQVRFHGRRVRGWVLGPTDDVPARTSNVTKLVSPIRFFDASMLELFRWIGERYLAPLAAVIARSVPPRVASEEGLDGTGVASTPVPRHDGPARLRSYRNGDALQDEIAVHGSGCFVLRPGPADEAEVAVECVGATLAAGRRAIVVVPEADPLPATAAAIRDAFGEVVALFLGGDKRERYRTWLDIAGGGFDVVVGTRPAVFAPLADVGLLYVHREGHTQHREERSPYSHVRDVARARARIERAVCVLSAFCPSLEASMLERRTDVEPPGRPWAPVELVRPGPEGRSPRLVSTLGSARGGFLYEPVPGYGLARVCRACGETAACASCGGALRLEAGAIRCTVCEGPGRCASCGASEFGIARGGAERVREWARRVTSAPVRRASARSAPRVDEVVVGGMEALKDVGSPRLDLVGILNADASLRRPGLSARERAVQAWFEAASWARPDGRVIVQTSASNDPAIQALVMARPDRFHRSEAGRRADAGFPVGAPVFRVAGTDELEAALAAVPHRTLLSTTVDSATVCLLALDPHDLAAFGIAVRGLAERGVVTRVEADPHL